MSRWAVPVAICVCVCLGGIGCRAVDADPYGLGDVDATTAGGASATSDEASPEKASAAHTEESASDPDAPVRSIRHTLPAAPPDVVARVDGEDLGAEAVLSALFLTHTDAVFAALEHAITERLVIKEGRRLGVTVSQAEVDAGVARVLADQRSEFQLVRGPDADLVSFLRDWYGVSEAAFVAAVRRRVTHELFLARVIRYEARQRDRVQYRVLVLPDRKSAEEAEAKLREGANFSAIARNQSLDESRRRAGGLFPPVAEDCSHPMLTGAEGLPAGAVTGVLPYVDRGQVLARLLKVERRIPADPRPYSTQARELEQELAESPLDPFELVEWDRRMRDRYPVEVGLWRA